MSAESGWAVDIYIDGVCSGNPGPGGWGALLKYGRHEKELSGGEAATSTSGRMRLIALIQALESLTRPCVAHVHADSMYLPDGVTKWLPGGVPDTWPTHLDKPVEYVDLWRQLSTAMEPHKVSWRWTDGQTRNPNNKRANRLAVEGMRQAIADREGSTADMSALRPHSEPTGVQDASNSGECVHEMPINWCSLCRPPKSGVLPYGYRTKGGNAYHNDPNCTWLDRGQRRADRQGKNVHDKVRIAWGEVTPGNLEPCESCCTPQWLKRHGY
jgi:ribonuclease HI